MHIALETFSYHFATNKYYYTFKKQLHHHQTGGLDLDVSRFDQNSIYNIGR